MASGTIGTTLLDRETYDKLWQGGGSGLDSWWAIEVEPWRCPGCGFECRYLTGGGDHRIIVWPAEDDPNLGRRAEEEDGRAVPYEKAMGACISFYALNPS